MKKALSIYDIAKMANVSVATVSKVLNDKKGVGEKTRQRVMKIITDNDFQPKTSSVIKDTIGFFTPTNNHIDVNGYYVHQVFDGIINEALMHRNSVVFADLSTLPRDPKQFRTYCTQHCIHSAIFALLGPVHEYVNKYGEYVPTVLIGSGFNERDCYKVNAENITIAKELVTHMAKLGHKKIYYITSYAQLNDNLERYEGYLEGIKENSIESLGIYDIIDQTEFDLVAQLKKLFENPKNSPTAIFCSSDLIAMKVVSCLKLLDIEVPDDVSVTGWDDHQFALHMNPSLTTIRQPEKKLGQVAASILLNKHINNNEPSEKSVVINSEIVLRDSLK